MRVNLIFDKLHALPLTSLLSGDLLISHLFNTRIANTDCPNRAIVFWFPIYCVGFGWKALLLSCGSHSNCGHWDNCDKHIQGTCSHHHPPLFILILITTTLMTIIEFPLKWNLICTNLVNIYISPPSIIHYPRGQAGPNRDPTCRRRRSPLPVASIRLGDAAKRIHAKSSE